MQSHSELDDQTQYALIDERLFQLFQRTIEEPVFAKHILVIQCVGGVGKSVHLRVFRGYCQKSDIPVALASIEQGNTSGEAGELGRQGCRAWRCWADAFTVSTV